MKLGAYTVMLTVLLLVLTFAGLNTTLTDPLEFVGIQVDNTASTVTGVDVENSSFWSNIFGSTAGILILLGTAGIVLIGLFGKGYDVSLIIAPLVVVVGAAYIVTFVGIISQVNAMGVSWITNVTTVLFGGLMVGFVWSCVDYFGGR